MRCRRNQIPRKHSLSLTMKNIYLCGADRIKCRGCKSLVDDQEQLRGAQNKSNARKGQGKPVDEEPLCGPRDEIPGRNGLSSTLKNKYAVEKISNGKRAVYS